MIINTLSLINSLSGKKEEVLAAILDTFFDKIKTDSYYLNICKYIKRFFRL